MKKTIKKVISLLFIFIMVFGSAPLAGFVGLELPELNFLGTKAEAAVYNGTCGENLTWTLDMKTGELIICGTGNMTNWSVQSMIPWYDFLFAIKKVSIGNGVTNIGNFSFCGCDILTSITIPDSVMSIGDRAFSGCDSLPNITIPDGVTSIGYGSFSYCSSLATVTIGIGLKNIGNDAFLFCSNLKTAYYVGTREQWRNVSIGSNNGYLTDNGIICECYSERPYYGGFCGDNLKWKLYTDGELFIYGTGSMINYDLYAPNNPWRDFRSLIKSVTFSDGVLNIGDYAFYSCHNLINVTFSDSITRIGDYAFGFCSKLDSPTIPECVTHIGDFAFWNCSALTSITVDSSNNSYSSDEYGVLFNKDKSELIQYPIGNIRSTYTIPDSVTSISDSAFKYCDTLTSVVIPDNVTSIGNDTFNDCDSLINVSIGNSVENIGSYAFSSCESLESVVISNSVKNINDHAFSGCTSLESVTIGESVKNIRSYAFSSCNNLTDVYYFGNESEWSNITIFRNNESLLNANIHFDHIHSVNTVEEGVDQTCIEKGYKTGLCVCGYRLTEEFSELGHNIIIDESVEATCIETGLTVGQHCSRCDDMTIEQEVIPALNHKDTLIQVESKEPTCTGIGWDDYEYCTACNYTTYIEKDALDHKVVIDEAVEATCTETGLTEGQHCSRCDEMTIEQEVVPVKGHDIIIDEAVESTCTETGLTEGQHCSRCDDMTIEQEVVPVKGHDIIIDEAVESTCIETGLTEGQHCSRCDEMTIEQEIVPIKPHNHTVKFDSAKHWKECVCGSIIEKQNHSFISGNTCECGFKRIVDSTIKIKNNKGSKTINYGETLQLTTIVTDKPVDAKIYWFVNGVKKGEGETFNITFESGTMFVEVKLVDKNGVVYQDTNGSEISDSENVTVNNGFFQKIISFFKNLFGMNRIVVQSIFKDAF